MAATEAIFNNLLKKLCAADFTDPSLFPRSALSELCFPSYDLDTSDEDVTAWIPRVQIIDEPNTKNPTKFVLDAAQMHQIACYVLPRELAFRRWRRLFSLKRDGSSFDKFKEKIQKAEQSLLIVRTTRGEMFGGYSDTPWEFDNSQGFHGGDRTKVFSFVNRDKIAASGGDDDNENEAGNDHGESRDDSEEKAEKKLPLTVYCWSGLNRDYQYCDAKKAVIAFGGGGDRFGLCIEQNFSCGSTAPCETFSNEKLASEDSFRIQDVEVWDFVSVEDTCCSSLLCLQPEIKPEEDMNWIPSVRVIREPNAPENFILDQPKMNQIARFVLPRTIASCRWKRVYSLSRDGDSFETCLHLVRKEPRSLMVIKTEDDQVFGGYADSPWRAANCNYYGSAQGNLWTFVKELDPDAALDISGSISNIESLDPNRVKVFKWTGINRYIQYCDITHRILAFGGGGDGGNFGLCVEKEFQRGSTGHCATFGNTPLCNQEHFRIIDMEIWGFATGKF